MSADVHPRIRARRHDVSEHRAHRRLRWVLVLMVLVGFGAAVYWLVESPYLAVERIVVSGDVAGDDVAAVVAAGGLDVGDPILFVRRGRVAAALVADPRIAEARVEVRYPHEVAVEVLAHRPVAWVRSGAGWLHTTADGHVVAATEEPGAGARLIVGQAASSPGHRVTEPDAVAALAFAAALPSELAATATVTASLEGLRAEVRGHRVELGGTDRMLDKASAVAALLAVVDAGARIDVTAPDRPAVQLPEAGKGSEEEPGQTEDQVEG